MKKSKKHKIWLIALAIPILIYFIWGHFGFAGAWVPGKYDAEKQQYKVFWGLGDKLIFYSNGTFRIAGYTPEFKQGLIDTTGKVVIPFLYKKVEQRTALGENLYVITNKSGKKGIINNKYKTIIPMEYDGIESIKPDFNFIMLKNGKSALLDKNGKEILPAQYSSVFYPDVSSSKPFIIAEKTTESYFVFPETKKQINQKFITIEFLFLPNNTVLINGILSKELKKTNHKIILGNYYNRSYEKYKKVKINETDFVNHYYGIFDSNGEALLPLEYDYIGIFENKKFAVVEKNHKMGIYNINVKDWLAKLSFSNIDKLPQNLPLFMLQDSENKKYYIDENGTIILSNKTNVTHIDANGHYLIFTKNKNRYKMQYNKDKQKFTWHKL